MKHDQDKKKSIEQYVLALHPCTPLNREGGVHFHFK